MLKSLLSPTAPRAVLTTLLLCAIARGAEPQPTPQARAHFNAGVGHLDDKRYAEAYAEFKEAYALTPRWTVLGNIGLAAEHLERDGEAIDAMGEYLKRGGTQLSAREIRTVKDAMGRLEKGIATVTLEAPGTFWIVDTRVDGKDPVINQYGPFDDRAELRVRAGQHDFKLDRASIAAPAWSAVLLAGDVASHAFTTGPASEIVEDFDAKPALLPAEPETDRDLSAPSHTASYVLWGTGALGIVATAVFVLEAKSTQNEADEDFARRCPLGAGIDGCETRTGGAERAASWRTAGLVTGIGTLGALATGTVLYFLDPKSSQATGHAKEASVEAWFSPTGIAVSGTF